MPDIITHYIFGLDTMQSIKHTSICKCINKNRDLFLLGLQGPDPFYYHRLLKKDNKAYIASRMHTEKTGDFLMSALCYIKKLEPSDKAFNECLSYISGFVCHYILDSMLHPYIFYFGGRRIDGIPETYAYTGLHRKIELAIDTILCMEKLNVKSSSFKVGQTVLKLGTPPESLRNLLNNTLFLNYGISEGGQLFNESYKDMKTYFKLTYDPLGTKKGFAKMSSPFISKDIQPLADAFSYHNCVNPCFDYMNRAKRVWLHPITGNVYTFSVYDIIRNAGKKSVTLLQAIYDFVTGDLSSEDLRILIPNISYLTGLSVEDTRQMKYISSSYTLL